jgi:hypothetical protein
MASNGSTKCLIGRIGAVHLRLDVSELKSLSADKLLDAIAKVIEALNRDPRVARVDKPKRIDEFISRNFVANDDLSDPDAVISDGTSYAWFEIEQPIVLKVHVPSKNQPAYLGTLEVAAEDYLALWNGSLLMVFWEQAQDTLIPLHGGQVVRDLLREAIVAAGFRAQVIGPSFAHMDIRITSNASIGPVFTREGTWEVGLALVQAWNPEGLAAAAMTLCRQPAEAFYRSTATATRIHFADVVLSNDLVELLKLQMRRSTVQLAPPWAWIVQRWEMRGWRRSARRIMSRMWLASAQLERLRSQWEASILNLNDAVREMGGVNVFDVDTTGDRRDVEATNVKFPLDAIAYVASRLDNRDVVVATALAALAGAVAGAIAGHFVASP